MKPKFVTSIRESGARTGYILTGYTPPDDCSYACGCGNEQTKSGFGGYIFLMKGSSSSTSFAIGGASSTTLRQAVVRYDSSVNLIANGNWLNRLYKTYSLFVTPKRYGQGSFVAGTFTKGSLYPNAELILGKDASSSTANAYDGKYQTFYVFGSEAQNAQSYNGLVNTYTPLATFRPCIYNGVVTMWHVEEQRPCTVVDGYFEVYEE